MPERAVTALFERYADAEGAIERLEALGIPHADIAILASRSPDAPDMSAPGTAPVAGEAEADAAGGTGTGATVGGLIGGGAGLLAGLGMLAVPGLGPIVAAGWLVSALTGAGIGAAAGGLVGGLTGAGMSETEAAAYAEGVRRGGTLVTVRSEEGRTEQVIAALKEAGSIDLDERAQGWRSEGWTGGTAAGPTDADGRQTGTSPAPTQVFGGSRH
ncbi:hypothetical protein [Methylobacterium sp. J-076]|uniref:hypothetical protein n=1 Tax=Methylobacterium sp. J-076 TaxID=2836655 RepID=UPI001FB9564A|nr:hypothetical protein [Methylobacterium sp. J-076]MCJ2013414.1 hypothetical protein [Methylobacterium sp. J-076]